MSKRSIAFGAAQPVLPGFGVGKWSRIATFGHKEQLQPDGSRRTWDFTPERFAEALVSYKTRFSQRRLGSDYEHQALRSAANGQPAPNLCYWDGMAVIEGDQVSGLQEQQPGPRPDPAALRGLLQERFPGADPSPAGLWVRCGEVTELGKLLIPNYEQLSPLFSDAQEDESGTSLGFSVSNISFVNVAHQDGTFFNFSYTDGTLHPSGPERKAMNEKEMLAKLGLGDDANKDQMKAAFDGYLDTTEDPKEARQAMRAAVMKKMSAFEGAEPFKGKETPAEEAAEEQAKKKLAEAQMSAQSQAMAALSAQHQKTAQELAELRAFKDSQEKTAYEGRLSAFCDQTIAQGKWEPSLRPGLAALARGTSEKDWPGIVKDVPMGTFSTSTKRLFSGGNPNGQRAGADFDPEYARGAKTVGFSATQQAFAALAQEGVKAPTADQLAKALRQVAHQNPSSLRETSH